MSEKRLVWVTRETYEALDARFADDRAVAEAYNAAPEPVARRRCITHDAGLYPDAHASGLWCWRKATMWSDGPCVFREEWCIPKEDAPVYEPVAPVAPAVCGEQTTDGRQACLLARGHAGWHEARNAAGASVFWARVESRELP